MFLSDNKNLDFDFFKVKEENFYFCIMYTLYRLYNISNYNLKLLCISRKIFLTSLLKCEFFFVPGEGGEAAQGGQNIPGPGRIASQQVQTHSPGAAG